MRTITALVAALFIAGCAGTDFSFENASKIQLGMTEGQVTNIMGPPYSVISRGNSQMWVWSHANGLTGSARSVSFEMSGGKVVSVPTIPGSFAGTSSTSSAAVAEQKTAPAAPASRQAYKDKQAQQLMQQHLPYEEYMRQLRAIEAQPD